MLLIILTNIFSLVLILDRNNVRINSIYVIFLINYLDKEIQIKTFSEIIFLTPLKELIFARVQ